MTQGAAQCHGHRDGRRILIDIMAGYTVMFEMMTDAERGQRKWTRAEKSKTPRGKIRFHRCNGVHFHTDEIDVVSMVGKCEQHLIC